MLATDPELNRIDMTGNEELSRLNVEEQARYRWMRVSFWWGMEGLYRQWDLGVLPNEEWQAWYRVICSTLESPGQRAFWEEEQNPVYIPQFVEIVESCDSFRGASPRCRVNSYSTTPRLTVSLQNGTGNSPALSVSTSNSSCSRIIDKNQSCASLAVRRP